MINTVIHYGLTPLLLAVVVIAMFYDRLYVAGHRRIKRDARRAETEAARALISADERAKTTRPMQADFLDGQSAIEYGEFCDARR